MHVAILLIDFGLVILAWMVQLIVYPGFTYYAATDFKRWHGQYSNRISLLVIPLMLGQLLLHGLLLIWQQEVVSVTTAVLIALAWLSTFLQAVPLHNQVAQVTDTQALAHKLVKVNWFRTLAWTAIFLLTLSKY